MTNNSRNGRINAIVWELVYGNIIDRRDRSSVIIDTWNYYCDVIGADSSSYAQNSGLDWNDVDSPIDIFALAEHIATGTAQDWNCWRSAIQDIYTAIMQPDKWAEWQQDIRDAQRYGWE